MSIQADNPILAAGRFMGQSAKDTPRVEAEKLSIWVKLFVLSVIIPVGMNVGSLYLTVNRLFLLVVIIPLGLKLISGKLGKFFWPDWAMILFVMWQAVCLRINNPDRMIELTGSIGLEYIGGYLLARAHIRTPAQFVALAKFLGLLMFALLPLAIYESLIGRPIILDLIRSAGFRTEVPIFNGERLGLRRAQVVMPHPILFGLYCSISFILCYVALKDTASAFQRWLYTGMAGVAAFLSLSSGAILAMLIQISMVVWERIFRRVKGRWLILIGLGVLAYFAVDLVSNRSPVRVFMSYASFSAHNAFWRGIIFEWGMINVWNNPIFGVGVNEWVRPHFMTSASIDNMWLRIAVQYGIPGFVIFTVPYLWVMWKVARVDLGEDQLLRTLRYAWMFCFVGLTFTLATVAIWKTVYCFVYFAFGAGVWLITAKPEDAGGKTPEAVKPDAPLRSRYTRFPVKPKSTTSLL